MNPVATRIAAALAALGAALHLMMLFAGSGMSGLGVLVSIAMAIGCFGCSFHLWTRPAVKALLVTALMSVAMIAMHLFAHGYAESAAGRGGGLASRGAGQAASRRLSRG